MEKYCVLGNGADFQYPPASILTMPPVWMTSQWMMDRYHKWLGLIKEQEKGNDKNEEE